MTSAKISNESVMLPQSASPTLAIISRASELMQNLTLVAETLLNQTFSAWEWIVLGSRIELGQVRSGLNENRELTERLRFIETPDFESNLPLFELALEGTSAPQLMRIGAEELPFSTYLERALWAYHSFGPRASNLFTPICNRENFLQLENVPTLREMPLDRPLPDSQLNLQELYHPEEELPFSLKTRDSKPRLLMIVPWLTMGGSDKFNLDLVEELKRNNWEVTIVTTLADPHKWTAEFMRYTTDILPMSFFLRPGDQPRFLRYAIESRKPDAVLISHTELGYYLLPYLRFRCPGPAYLDYCHLEALDWLDGGYPNLAVKRGGYFDLNVVSSFHLQNWLVSRGAKPERVEVAYTNIDTEKWTPSAENRSRVRAEFNVADDTPIILYACRIVKQKQPKIFAYVMRELKNLAIPFLCLVSGDGEDLPWLEAFVRENGLESHVRLLGANSNERVQEFMSGSDIFFLPSEWEGISLAIYEAMSMGLAIVGADVGGQSELVTPGCGRLVSRGDDIHEVRDYVQALRELLSDIRMCRTLGASARERVKTCFELRFLGTRMIDLIAKAKSNILRRANSTVSSEMVDRIMHQTLDYGRLSTEINSSLDRFHQMGRDLVAKTQALQTSANPSQEEINQALQLKSDYESLLKLLENKIGERELIFRKLL